MNEQEKQMFTPGPWKVIGMYIAAETSRGDDIEVAQVALYFTEYAENARLIATAPDLLSACESFVEAWDKSLQLEKTDTVLRLARAAIAKARGEQ